MSFSYAEDENVDQRPKTVSNDLTVERCFGIISETITQRLAFPNWLYKLPIKQFSIRSSSASLNMFLIRQSRIRKIDQAWKQLATFVNKSVELCGEQLTNNPNLLDERPDVFTRLVAANDEKAKYQLDKSEVVSKARSLTLDSRR